MRTKMEWVTELQRHSADPQKLQQIVGAIQSEAARAGIDQAMNTALGIVSRSKSLTDDKIVQLKAQG